MKQIIDRIAYSFIGILILILLEGMCTLGLALKVETYTWVGWTFQGIFVFLAVWIANNIYDAEHK